MNDCDHYLGTNAEEAPLPRPKTQQSQESPSDSPAAPCDIRDLFSFQLQRLAGLSTRIAMVSIGPQHSLTVREWRALAVLDYLQEAPLQQLANHSGLLKSQMSRTISGLIDRGLVHRSENPEDGRSILLRLTPQGTRLVERILIESETRNEEMLAPLTEEERRRLSDYLDKVFASSLAYYRRLRKTMPRPPDLDRDDG